MNKEETNAKERESRKHKNRFRVRFYNKKSKYCGEYETFYTQKRATDVVKMYNAIYQQYGIEHFISALYRYNHNLRCYMLASDKLKAKYQPRDRAVQ